MQNKAKIGVGVGVGVVVLVAVIVVVVVTTSKDDKNVAEPWNQVRLPSWIRADKYNLNLNMMWKNMTYTGTQEITLNVTEKSDYILVHARDLTIDSKQTLLMSEDNAPLEIKETFRDSDRNASLKNDFYIIKAKKSLEKGVYKVKIYFSGHVATDKLTGVYQSKYFKGDPQNKEPVFQVSTDFEPVDARSAFPCLDEPDQKGRWTIKIAVTFPETIDVMEYSIISNMEMKEEDKNEITHTITTSFEESVPMSTYLVCFAISNFAYKEGVYTRDDNSEVKLRVFARREVKFQDSAVYALKVTKAVLKEYEKFYKVQYPLNKLDQIALPEFNSGAMENWGLVTYRESSLLYDETSSSNDEKQRVCAVIAHELAHQWFGNIVTMAWWNDLWLNEGFASFVEYYGINATEPDWDIMQFMYTDEITVAMTPDSSPSSHPISVDVERPEDIGGLFDTISYRKGSSINYMMMNFMGEDDKGEKRFSNGIMKYIEKYQFKNAEMIDLFNSLNEAAEGINVTEIMLTWTKQMGFPYVTVSRNQDGDIVINQTRFLVGEKKEDDVSEFNYKWHIPFTYISDKTNDPSDVIWLTPGEDEKVLNDTKDVKWIKGNARGYYYYIVHYANTTMKEELSKATLSDKVDRASRIHDVFQLASIGKGTYEEALKMTEQAVDETEYIVLNTVLNEVISAGNSAIDKETEEDVYKKYQAYVAKLAKKQATDLGWVEQAGESWTAPKLRARVLKTYCLAVGDKNDPIVSEALTKFNTFKPDGNRDNIKNVLDTVVRSAIKYDENDTNWDALFEILKKSDWEAAQREYLRALSMATNLTTIDKLLEYGESDKAVLDPWRYVYYANFYGKHYEHCWKRLQKNWEYYSGKYNGTSFTMGYLLEIPSVFDTQDKLNEVEKFFKKPEIDKTIGTGRKTMEETLDTIRNNIKWKERYAESVKAFFNATS